MVCFRHTRDLVPTHQARIEPVDYRSGPDLDLIYLGSFSVEQTRSLRGQGWHGSRTSTSLPGRRRRSWTVLALPPQTTYGIGRQEESTETMRFLPYDGRDKHRRVRCHRPLSKAERLINSSSLIAIMLGRLEMSIDDCIDRYLEIMDRVFRKIRHRINVKGKFQGRYDTEELKHCIKDIIADQGINSNERFRVEGYDRCKV